MEKKHLNFYKESGVASPFSVILSFTASSLCMIVLSYFYSLIITFLPFVYFNIILVILYGYSSSLIANAFNTLFKIRNRKKSIIIVIAVAAIAFYSQWVSYLYIISSPEVSLSIDFDYYLSIFSSPNLNLQNIIELGQIGSWEMLSITFNGFLLWSIWFCEMALILCAAYYGVSNMRNKPFSESDNTWFKRNAFDLEFEAIKLRKNFISDYERNPFEAITSLEKPDAIRYSKIYIYSSKSETKNLISIENVFMSEGGKSKKEIEEIIAPHYIDTNYIIQLKQKYSVKKSSFFDFFYDLYN